MGGRRRRSGTKNGIQCGKSVMHSELTARKHRMKWKKNEENNNSKKDNSTKSRWQGQLLRQIMIKLLPMQWISSKWMLDPDVMMLPITTWFLHSLLILFAFFFSVSLSFALSFSPHEMFYFFWHYIPLMCSTCVLWCLYVCRIELLKSEPKYYGAARIHDDDDK